MAAEWKAGCEGMDVGVMLWIAYQTHAWEAANRHGVSA